MVNLTVERMWKEQKFVDSCPDKIDMRMPTTLEEFHKTFMGDPDWSGELYIYVMSRSAYLVVHSDDLDQIEWEYLSNVILLDAVYSRETFTQYLAQAKNRVAGKRGQWTMTLYLMTTDMYNDICMFTQEES